MKCGCAFPPPAWRNDPAWEGVGDKESGKGVAGVREESEASGTHANPSYTRSPGQQGVRDTRESVLHVAVPEGAGGLPEMGTTGWRSHAAAGTATSNHSRLGGRARSIRTCMAALAMCRKFHVGSSTRVGDRLLVRSTSVVAQRRPVCSPFDHQHGAGERMRRAVEPRALTATIRSGPSNLGCGSANDT